MNDLRRRECVQLEVGISVFDGAEEILVPGERQVRVVASLEEQLDAADFDRLINLSEDLVEAEHVTLDRSHIAIERAEVALRDTDVRVVDVAVDDIGNSAIRMLAQTDLVGKATEHMRRRMPIERQCLVRADADAIADLAI